MKNRNNKEEIQNFSSDTAVIIVSVSDKLSMKVFKLDYDKIEMLIWLSESRDLDQTNEELMSKLVLIKHSTIKK